MTLPMRVAMPAQEVTMPSTDSPPVFLGRIKAGSTASKAEATRFTPARNRIRFKISPFSFK